jgi:DNA-binding transcriptional LysR family regulator
MLPKAATHGLGVPLIPKFLVEDELARGLLVQAVKHEYISDRSYYLIHPERKARTPALAAFREWLTSAAHDYREPMGLGKGLSLRA